MELTEKQKKGIDIAVQRYYEGEKYTVIAGAAGTGKTTIAGMIIDQLPVAAKSVCFVSFTGKAAQVLQKKGNKNAMTLHKLLYNSTQKKDGTYIRTPKIVLEYSVVVVDEISMVSKSLMDLLFKHKVYVICLGDPMQLPTLYKNEDNHLLDSPHIFLDEIVRQEAASEIIQAATAVRQGKRLFPYKGKDIQVYNKNECTDGMLLWADQIIVGTNAMRATINERMRILLGRGSQPESGDKVICLKNYWDELSANTGESLINGTIGYLSNIYSSTCRAFKLRGAGWDTIGTIEGGFISDSNDVFNSLVIDKQQVMTGQRSITPEQEYRQRKAHRLVPMEFTYGYAITCHKSQGSEWDKVLVIEESFPFDREEHLRWLYTACTRAAKKLVVILNR